MDLTIVIVNWNTREMLRGCLESIVSCSFSVSDCRVSTTDATPDAALPSSLSLEVIVVDNASTDGSVEILRECFPWVKVIGNAENVGFARANNQALRESRGQYVLLLNSDAALAPGAIETLVGFMDAHPRAGACGPYLLNGDGATLQPSCHPMMTPWREAWRLLFLDRLWPQATYPMARWDPTTPREVEVIKGACLLLRQAALDEVGPLDAQYFMYTEEMDLCHRLARAGWTLHWVPQARVIHYGEASSKQDAEAMYLQLYRSKVQFHRKFGGERRARWFKLLVSLAYLPRWGVMVLGQMLGRAWHPRARVYGRLLRRIWDM